MSEHRFGLSVALATPFDQGGTIDTLKAIAHARWCLANGCSSITLFGTTGEGSSIGNAERDGLLGAFMGQGIEPGQIVVGVMANSVADAALQSQGALDAGCKGVLLAPPSYFKGVAEEGLYAWFAGVFETLGAKARGFYLYNIPSVTAVELPISLIGRLKTAFPAAVAGVKDSSGNWPYTEALLAAHSDLAILIGDERGLAAGVRRGGQGAISGLANVFPERMVALANEGREDTAIVDLVNDLVKHPVIPGVKALIARRHGDDGWLRVRAPLRSLSEADARHFAGLVDGIGRTAAA